MKNLKLKTENIEKEKGFTLIELLIVIAIIAIISSFLMVNFVGIRQRARDGQRKGDLFKIQSALEMYRADVGSYPLQLNNCPENNGTYLGNSPTCDTVYLQSISIDPINSDKYVYSYIPNDERTSYSLIACLENVDDSQRDKNLQTGEYENNSVYCTGTDNWSYTVKSQ